MADQQKVTAVEVIKVTLSNGAIFDELERPQIQISRSGHILWRWISPKWLKIRP